MIRFDMPIIIMIIVYRRSLHIYVNNVNGLMWDCYISSVSTMAMNVLEDCLHSGTVLGQLYLSQDPVTSG